MNEAALIAALRAGHTEALGQIFDHYSNRVYRLALGLLQDEQLAEDITQEAFMRLLEHIHTFEGRSQLGTWLYRVAYNACLAQLRRGQKETDWAGDESEDEGPPLPSHLIDWRNLPEEQVTAHELQGQVAAALASLSPNLRAVFILRDVEDLSTEETAQTLGIGASAVKVRLHRARLALRESLAAYLETQYQEP